MFPLTPGARRGPMRAGWPERVANNVRRQDADVYGALSQQIQGPRGNIVLDAGRRPAARTTHRAGTCREAGLTRRDTKRRRDRYRRNFCRRNGAAIRSITGSNRFPQLQRAGTMGRRLRSKGDVNDLRPRRILKHDLPCVMRDLPARRAVRIEGKAPRGIESNGMRTQPVRPGFQWCAAGSSGIGRYTRATDTLWPFNVGILGPSH